MTRIGNGAGFLGDNIDAPRRLVESVELDYLTLEYLAELTLSILAASRAKDPNAGFAQDLIDVLGSLGPALQKQPQLKIITNGGGMNPHGCAARAAQTLVAAGLGDMSVAVVTGDDFLARLDEIQAAGCQLVNLDTGQPINELKAPVASANAYLGAQPIADALAGDARLVITGRVADASLTLGPAVHELGWQWDDWNTLAAGSVAGHLIECGAQVTGGLYRHWQNLNLAEVGYPIAEIEQDGSCVISKPAGSGGEVSVATVSEQLVYEIGDPAHYLTPDVDVDFTTVELSQLAADRIKVTGATGRPATDTYKVSLAYRDGYFASGQLLVYGRDCVDKAKACAEIILAKIRQAGYELDRAHVECLGAGEGTPGLHQPPADLREVMLRVTVQDHRREAVERFSKEFAPLITSGPPGLAGYASGRPAVRPVIAYWPTLVPKQLCKPRVVIRTAAQWLPGGTP